jgi:OmpA-OmpF porin, OOP family
MGKAAVFLAHCFGCCDPVKDVRNSTWLFIGLLALVILTYVCVDAHGPAVSAAIGREIPRPKDPPEPTESSLLITEVGDHLVLSGAVPSYHERDAILQAAKQAFPTRTLDESIAVEPSAKARSWLHSAPTWLAHLATLRDAELSATGEIVRISGAMEGDKEAILGTMRSETSARILDGIRVRTRRDQAQDLISAFLDTHKIEFEVSSVELTTASEDMLKDLATLLKRDGAGFALEIEGHTDNTGMIVANRQLSRDRADRVRDTLTRFGLDPEKISARGYGSERPIADNSTDEGKKKNRRIEIHLR